MNTTSMEFVIAQEKTNKSPSVLSEFMGISKNMEQALLVNPWDLGVSNRLLPSSILAFGGLCNAEHSSPDSILQGVAAAINKGLLMSDAEKASRHQDLYKVVTTHTSHSWAAVLVKMLLEQMGLQGMARQTPYIPKDQLEGLYKSAKKRLFLFDYDVRWLFFWCKWTLLTHRTQGTLAPIVKIPSMATPSEATLEALERLSADPQNLVYIISGRDGEFLEQHLGHLHNVGFSAEHGGFVRERGSKEWTNFTKSLDMSWMSEVEEIFRYYTEVCACLCFPGGLEVWTPWCTAYGPNGPEGMDALLMLFLSCVQRTTGSHIEVKKSSITWHYRGADPEWG